MQGYFVLEPKMKSFLLFFVCVALVSYHGAQGEDKTEEVSSQEDEGRRQFPNYPRPNANAQGAANANAQAAGWTLTWPPTFTWPSTTTRRPYQLHTCYSCNDCPNPSRLTPTCYTYGNCVHYVEKFSHQRSVVHVRGCESERGNCQEIKRELDHRPNVRLLECDECLGDNCNTNGVGRSLPDLTAALFFVLVTPILTKYALS